MTVIEHYPAADGCGEHYDQVVLSGPSGQAEWRRILSAPLCRMLGLAPPALLDPVWGQDSTARYSGAPGEAGVTVEAADGTPLGVLATDRGYTWGGGGADYRLAADLLADVTGQAPDLEDVERLAGQVIVSLPAYLPWTLTAAQIASFVQ